MKLVVDSSVALKWFVREPGHEAALRRLDGDDPLIAPDLLLAEVGNALWRKARKGEVDPDQIGKSIAELGSTLILRPVTVEMSQIEIEIMQDIQHSMYDCLFLAVALQERWTS